MKKTIIFLFFVGVFITSSILIAKASVIVLQPGVDYSSISPNIPTNLATSSIAQPGQTSFYYSVIGGNTYVFGTSTEGLSILKSSPFTCNPNETINQRNPINCKDQEGIYNKQKLISSIIAGGLTPDNIQKLDYLQNLSATDTGTMTNSLITNNNLTTTSSTSTLISNLIQTSNIISSSTDSSSTATSTDEQSIIASLEAEISSLMSQLITLLKAKISNVQ
ncbi:MAG: hypothetical protein WCO18_00305 [bacterium]